MIKYNKLGLVDLSGAYHTVRFSHLHYIPLFVFVFSVSSLSFVIEYRLGIAKLECGTNVS